MAILTIGFDPDQGRTPVRCECCFYSITAEAPAMKIFLIFALAALILAIGSTVSADKNEVLQLH
jgi:hypothetical protein